ncbi:hypothetical protein CEXT_771311 [Caerostris extrusa]|uniref:Uncharacterized protein n=1 Tax=Caerostris extrusa TaxID=172846 RepID=A0AAV4SLY5_CAEEX|nr:hypothetical protein CEXT_771311 [Caerostris extrusa]
MRGEFEERTSSATCWHGFRSRVLVAATTATSILFGAPNGKGFFFRWEKRVRAGLAGHRLAWGRDAAAAAVALVINKVVCEKFHGGQSIFRSSMA